MALREGWGGRRLHHVAAQGILIGTLGVLELHFRIAAKTYTTGVTSAPDKCIGFL
jgi:hypothetical protein